MAISRKDDYKVKQIDQMIADMEDDFYESAKLHTTNSKTIDLDIGALELLKKYYSGTVTESKKLKEYVNNEVQKAWDLLDDWFEREWGEIPYNESAKAILVDEFLMDIFVDGDYVEGTGAVVLNLISCEAHYDVYDDNGDEYATKTEDYSNIQDMIDKLIQPMHDGKITEDDLYAKLERIAY